MVAGITESGGNRAVSVDVCLLTAMNCDLKAEIEAEGFRKDFVRHQATSGSRIEVFPCGRIATGRRAGQRVLRVGDCISLTRLFQLAAPHSVDVDRGAL